MGSGAPRGAGQVVRLPRGASLSDFADRINANPGSLVQEMFNLGEMVTATQSCSDDTLLLLGEHLGFDVQIVSPEDEDRELLARFDIDLDADIDEDRLVTRPPLLRVRMSRSPRTSSRSARSNTDSAPKSMHWSYAIEAS